MAEDKINVSPDVCSSVSDDESKLNIEISLPGVKKEDITLKMLEDSFTLSAPRDDIKYVTTLSICCPVIPDKAKAEYNNGLLKIEVPFKNTQENALEIKVK